jgi:hypothetical protein
MGYRDELAAARARIAALEADLEEQRQRSIALETELENARRPPKASIALTRRDDGLAGPAPPLKRVVGRIFYHPPRTYWPLVSVYRAALRAAFARTPRLDPPTSRRVVAWAAYYALGLPFVYGIWLPLYVASLVILLPWAAILCTVGSIPLFGVVVLSRFSFDSASPSGESGWFHGGEVSESAGAMFLWFILSLTLQPLLVPCIPLLNDHH